MQHFRYLRRLCATIGLIIAAAPLHAETRPACSGAAQPKQVAELLFGRDVAGRPGVSDRDWSRFVARELTPRFPDGLTVSDAQGQWRDPASGKTVREKTKRVEIVLPGRDDDDARLVAAVDAYKHDFHQQSVGLIVRTACVLF